MKILWQRCEHLEIDKKILEGFVVKRHYNAVDFLFKEMGFANKPEYVKRLVFTPDSDATYYRAGEKEGVNEDTIEMGVKRKVLNWKDLIEQIKWDIIHETGHHLHYKRRPDIVKNAVWGRSFLMTYPLDNWYLREIVCEYCGCLFYNHKKEKIPLSFPKVGMERLKPVLSLFREDKSLLRELVDCDELNIPEKFFNVIIEMDNPARARFNLPLR